MRNLRACVNCHCKKIKCNARYKKACTACDENGLQCVPYSRNKKAPVQQPQQAVNGDVRMNDVNQKPRRNIPAQVNTNLAQDLESLGQRQSRPAETSQARFKPRSFCFDEAMVTPWLAESNPKISQADLHLLREQGAFTLPTDSDQRELIETFLEYGHAWTPVLDPAWLSGTSPSFLLIQAIFVAASKLTNQPDEHGSSADFYRRAKLLFFSNVEQDPLILIASAILLSWYNPTDTEASATDTSTFWLHTAQTIAFQINLHKEPPARDPQRGLRRRLWWTLVSLDCTLSATTGQPRSLHPADSDVTPPAVSDFSEPSTDTDARIFPVYMSICTILGDTVQHCLRHDLTFTDRQSLENALFYWLKQTLPSLTNANQSLGDSLQARQVLAIYLATLILLDQPLILTPTGLPSTRSLLTSSFITGLLREFLERDELCHLTPALPFYALCAGSILTQAARIQSLANLISADLLMLNASLRVLFRQWRSAGLVSEMPRAMDSTTSFFEGFDTKWCRLWRVIVNGDVDGDETMAAATPAPAPALNYGDADVAIPLMGSNGPFDYIGSLGESGGDQGSVMDLNRSGSWILDGIFASR